MYRLNDIYENELISMLARKLPRAPHQINSLHESDAELISLPGSDIILAVTFDSIVEEIQTGLYRNPYLIGWMMVTVSASDLAAVGAKPIGIMLTETIRPESSDEFLNKLQSGIGKACEKYGLYVLGGDTNISDKMQMGATAIGIIADGRYMTRRGCNCGDLLFASGPLGIGSAFALINQLKKGRGWGKSIEFMPVARLEEGRILRNYASCCMDTSDGALVTLDQLMRLNNVGFDIEMPLERILHPKAMKAAERYSLPLWTFLAGPHGEFELIFTIPEKYLDEFIMTSKRMKWSPIKMGRVTNKPEIRIVTGDMKVVLPTGRTRNLFDDVNHDGANYITELLAIDKQIMAGKE
ncbi:MAG: thiamine-phosphate kinase [Candidatus Zixiibacteriota bacterium]